MWSTKRFPERVVAGQESLNGQKNSRVWPLKNKETARKVLLEEAGEKQELKCRKRIIELPATKE